MGDHRPARHFHLAGGRDGGRPVWPQARAGGVLPAGRAVGCAARAFRRFHFFVGSHAAFWLVCADDHHQFGKNLRDVVFSSPVRPGQWGSIHGHGPGLLARFAVERHGFIACSGRLAQCHVSVWWSEHPVVHSLVIHPFACPGRVNRAGPGQSKLNPPDFWGWSQKSAMYGCWAW